MLLQSMHQVKDKGIKTGPYHQYFMHILQNIFLLLVEHTKYYAKFELFHKA